MNKKNDKLEDSLAGLFGGEISSPPVPNSSSIPEDKSSAGALIIEPQIPKEEPEQDDKMPDQRLAPAVPFSAETQLISKKQNQLEQDSPAETLDPPEWEPVHRSATDQDPGQPDLEQSLPEDSDQPGISLDYDHVERVVVFSLESESFGVDIYSIRTLVKPQDIYPVPHMPDYLIGLTNLRGEIVPVIDLRTRLGFPDREYSEDTRFVVAEKRDEPICLVVDNVSGIEYFDPEDLEEPSDVISSIDTTYLHAIGKSEQSLVLLLDLDQVLGDQILEFNN